MKPRASKSLRSPMHTPPPAPVSEADRLLRGFALESGEAQPRPPAARLH